MKNNSILITFFTLMSQVIRCREGPTRSSFTLLVTLDTQLLSDVLRKL